MRYSVRTGRWSGKPQRPAGPDPHTPGSPGYAERHRETVTTLPGGIVRVDMGEPIGPPPPAKPRRSPTAPVTAEPGAPSAPATVPQGQPKAVNSASEARDRFRLSPTPS